MWLLTRPTKLICLGNHCCTHPPPTLTYLAVIYPPHHYYLPSIAPFLTPPLLFPPLPPNSAFSRPCPNPNFNWLILILLRFWEKHSKTTFWREEPFKKKNWQAWKAKKFVQKDLESDYNNLAVPDNSCTDVSNISGIVLCPEEDDQSSPDSDCQQWGTSSRDVSRQHGTVQYPEGRLPLWSCCL